jgi:sulfide:quinone oxidoreductase
MSERSVVVLGGGIGGIVAARMLRKQVPKDVRVVLVDRDKTYLFAPSLLWLMSGDREPGQISRGRERLARKGIELVTGEVEGLDAGRRTVRVGGRDIAFERLVIASAPSRRRS